MHADHHGGRHHDQQPDPRDRPQHLALVTANPAKAKAWLGGREAHLFDMPLSVGGRFSLWSAASLGCMVSLGPDVFREILAGAAETVLGLDDLTGGLLDLGGLLAISSIGGGDGAGRRRLGVGAADPGQQRPEVTWENRR